MADRFKLRCALPGHEKDVRGVCAAYYPDGAIISASRDVTSRVWVPNEQDASFTEGHMMSGHSNFVSCVCVMPPDDKYPQGLIVTGSNDNEILAYTLESPQPIYRLKGHTDTVCSLASGKFGTLISASWDKTAKVWLNQKCVMTLAGHEAAVWAVAIMPEGGFMLTGSADKLIKLWRAGKCEQTYAGHRDCVRGLAVLSTVEFLSCSNDYTIRRWLTTGECTHTYEGHTSFVYSLAVLPNGEDFVSSGEDRSLRVWRDGQCSQTITHPTESVWSICVLPNGDIVSGASDGQVRVFTTSPERAASEDLQKAFEEELASSSIPAQIGDIETDQLPGPEVLLNPGKRDGQVMMVKDGLRVEAHQWNAAEGRWIKVGDVTGGKGTEAAGGKKAYLGKTYDYVFDVELDEGAPALKLPFNKGDDPWMAAHKFLQDNDMSPLYLDQVAKFITEQVKDVTIGPAATQYKDPFTGDGAYVPAAFAGEQQQQFDAAPPAAQAAPPTQFYPKTSYIGFDQANAMGILSKMREINGKVEASQRINENVLESFEHMMNGEAASAMQLEMLWKALQWPVDVRYPALDVLRLAIRSATTNEHFCNAQDGPAFLGHLLAPLEPSAPMPVQMLSLRCLVNFFRQPAGANLLRAHLERLPAVVQALAASSNKNVQTALASLLLNLAVSVRQRPEASDQASVMRMLADVCQDQTEPEAVFRLLVAIGTVVAGDKNATEIAKTIGLVKFASSCRKMTEPKKVMDCAKKLTNDLLS